MEDDKSLYTVGEKNYLAKVSDKLDCLKSFLNESTINFMDVNLNDIHWHVSQIKSIIGNFDNDVSFIACLMAKNYLIQEHHIINYDASSKPQSAPGLDIDIIQNNERIIGEIKTTYPYGESDFGSKQREMLLKDFNKLQNNDAKYKYFFVTEDKTYNIVNEKYKNFINGIKVVLLPFNESFKTANISNAQIKLNTATNHKNITSVLAANTNNLTLTDGVWNAIVSKIIGKCIELPTVPKTNRKPVWFSATTNGEIIFINQSKTHTPSSNLSIERKLNLQTFRKVYPLYLKRENGEQVSSQVTSITVDQVYYFSLIKHLG